MAQIQTVLGNLNAKRDWGYALEYVEGMWLMLQQEEPKDLVMATGESHTVREFVDLAFSNLNMQLEWEGEGINEKGANKNGKIRVEIDKHYFRPTEVDSLLGDASYAQKLIGWEPQIDFETLVTEMVEHDLNLAKQEQLLREHGYWTPSRT